MRGRTKSPLMLILIVLSLVLLGASAFTRPVQECGLTESRRRHRQSSSSSLPMGNIFYDIVNFFEDFGNDKSDDENKDDNGQEDTAAGTFRISTIPVSQMKQGGLRLFLMFYFMGMQNTPSRMSWKADQPTTEEYVVDCIYHDRTAALTVTLLEDEITIDRVGSTPSTAYMMQEAVILQGLLDELHVCAFDDTIDTENRLLVLPEPQDAIEKARDALAFS